MTKVIGTELMIECVKLYKMGHTQKQIAKSLEVTQSKVSWLLKRFRELNPELSKEILMMDKRTKYKSIDIDELYGL